MLGYLLVMTNTPSPVFRRWIAYKILTSFDVEFGALVFWVYRESLVKLINGFLKGLLVIQAVALVKVIENRLSLTADCFFSNQLVDFHWQDFPFYPNQINFPANKLIFDVPRK